VLGLQETASPASSSKEAIQVLRIIRLRFLV
jgi:hypothetical protein